MSGLCACFDIDETLVTTRSKAMNLSYTKHLESIAIKMSGVYREYYAINISPMTKIFDALLRKNIPIVFITSASYPAELFLGVLEIIYKLAKGALSSCQFINKKYAVDKGISRGDGKGAIMAQALADGLLPTNVDLVLIDNDLKHVMSAIEKGFQAIHVDAIPVDGGDPNNDYLFDIIEKFNLKVSLSVLDEFLPRKRCRLRYR